MPILIWIATLACMMEMSGILPHARTVPEREEPAPPRRD
jgi:hypothetical protein